MGKRHLVTRQLHSSGGLTGFAVGRCPRSAREAIETAAIRSIPCTLCGEAASMVDRQGLVVTPEFLLAEGSVLEGCRYGSNLVLRNCNIAGPLREEDPLQSWWLRSNVRSVRLHYMYFCEWRST